MHPLDRKIRMVDMVVLEGHIVLDMVVLGDRIVLEMVVVEDELPFDIVADNVETAEYMVVNIVAGSIAIVNIVNIVDIGVDNHSQSLDMLLGIHIRSLKDSHHILVGHNYID
ncbi:hypothetical protein A3K80_01840 [Candidatus Bathyarchaeota archaeon RBG_13_38_9]|nr:MAG: hypothetical protein A3K80_01840 [Candidatus Bathyarchaeota archaeon RBG_13_38_9]